MRRLNMWRLVMAASIALWMLGIGLPCFPVGAQELRETLPSASRITDTQSSEAGAFGQNSQDFWVSAFQFKPSIEGRRWTHQSFGYFANTTTNGSWGAQVQLPIGALVTGLQCFFNDTHVVDNATVWFLKDWYDTISNQTGEMVITTFSTAGSSGFQQPSSPALNTTIRSREGSLANTYQLSVMMPATTSVSFKGCRFFWQRQITPAPLVATFSSDVPTSHTFFRYIEALAAAGITGGCASGRYCPEQPTTRGQMAVFLATALGLHFPY